MLLSRNDHITLLAGVILLLFALSVTGCSMESESTEAGRPEAELKPGIYDITPYLDNEAALEEGRELFQLKCSQCHGEDAKGGPEAPDLTDSAYIYGSGDKDAFKTVYYGTENGMPTWKESLGPENIWKILAFLKKLKE